MMCPLLDTFGDRFRSSECPCVVRGFTAPLRDSDGLFIPIINASIDLTITSFCGRWMAGVPAPKRVCVRKQFTVCGVSAGNFIRV